MREFWINNKFEIITSYVFILLLIVSLLALSRLKKKNNKLFTVGTTLVILVIAGLNFLLIKNVNDSITLEITKKFVIELSPVVRIIITNLIVITLLLISLYKISKEKVRKKLSTSSIAIIGVLVALASVLMFFGIPFFGAPYLKIEVSGLIMFLVFIWFDFKTAVITSLLTNFLHAIMPGTSVPVILFLDELVNFVATMAFLAPSVLLLKRDKDGKIINSYKVIPSVIIGILFTTVFMVIYNYTFNLPIVYEMNLTFLSVLKTFGLFNIIKWGSVGLLIILLWEKLSSIIYINNN